MRITIPEPCHESWSEMTPTELGRHCSSCAKTVVDFTKMSDAQVLAHLKKASGNTCGHFRNDQLERKLVEPIIRGIPRWISVGLASIAAVLGSTIAFGQQIQGDVESIIFDKSIEREPVDTVELAEVAVTNDEDSASMQVDETYSHHDGQSTVNLPEAVVTAYKADLMEVEETSQGLILTSCEIERLQNPELQFVTPKAVTLLLENLNDNKIGSITVGTKSTSKDFSRFSFRYYLR